MKLAGPDEPASTSVVLLDVQPALVQLWYGSRSVCGRTAVNSVAGWTRDQNRTLPKELKKVWYVPFHLPGSLVSVSTASTHWKPCRPAHPLSAPIAHPFLN